MENGSVGLSFTTFSSDLLLESALLLENSSSQCTDGWIDLLQRAKLLENKCLNPCSAAYVYLPQRELTSYSYFLLPSSNVPVYFWQSNGESLHSYTWCSWLLLLLPNGSITPSLCFLHICAYISTHANIYVNLDPVSTQSDIERACATGNLCNSKLHQGIITAMETFAVEN